MNKTKILPTLERLVSDPIPEENIIYPCTLPLLFY